MYNVPHGKEETFFSLQPNSVILEWILMLIALLCILQDSFYHSLSDEKLQKVHEYNFDHPGEFTGQFAWWKLQAWSVRNFVLDIFNHCSDAFNTELLLSCMEKLKLGREVSIPGYDFKSHRSTEAACKVLNIYACCRLSFELQCQSPEAPSRLLTIANIQSSWVRL